MIDGIALANPFCSRAKRLNYWISRTCYSYSTNFNWSPLFITRPDNRLTRQEELHRTAPETRERKRNVNDRGTVFRFKLRMIAESRQIGTRRDSPAYLSCLPTVSAPKPSVALVSSSSLICIPFPLSNDRSSSAAGRARTCIEITRRNVYTRGE